MERDRANGKGTKHVAIKLQYLTIVVRREALRRCKDIPPYLAMFNQDGGIFLDTTWYDDHLWCETVMNGFDVEEVIAELEDYGLQVPPDGEAVSDDVCLAESQWGPSAQCDWLAYDPSDNCVWLAGTEKGRVIGGWEQVAQQEQRLAELRSSAERHYTEMYESRYPKDDFEDACAALHQAKFVARFLHHDAIEVELEEKENHFRTVYNTQFRR